MKNTKNETIYTVLVIVLLIVGLVVCCLIAGASARKETRLTKEVKGVALLLAEETEADGAEIEMIYCAPIKESENTLKVYYLTVGMRAYIVSVETYNETIRKIEVGSAYGRTKD